VSEIGSREGKYIYMVYERDIGENEGRIRGKERGRRMEGIS
jgi:hypothetical protein